MIPTRSARWLAPMACSLPRQAFANPEVHDQKRIATPAQAIARGADYLVVGRPITQASDPAAAARRIVADMERGATHRAP